eukprot:1158097-Pelagomonas_calceolata.AAC.3
MGETSQAFCPPQLPMEASVVEQHKSGAQDLKACTSKRRKHHPLLKRKERSSSPSMLAFLLAFPAEPIRQTPTYA